MSGKGRGHIFTSLTGAESHSSQRLNKDSGLESSSPISTGEYRRLGRGKLIDDLNSLCSSMSVSSSGRGITDPVQKEEEINTSDNLKVTRGRGRAMIFENILSTGQEDLASEKAVNVGVQQSSSEINFTAKNIHGAKGIPVKLACNYIRLNSEPNKGVFVYEVRYSPNVDSTSLRVKYLNEHRDKIGGSKTFDGVILYLPILLKDKLTTFVSKSVADNSDVEIRILFKRQEQMKNCTHLYNILFDRVMKTLNYVRFDRKQFDPNTPKIIPHSKLEVWPGYVTAVDEYEEGLMLCCDVSHRLLCQKTVLEMLVEIYQTSTNNFQENAKKTLLGSVVITRYNNRTYRIDDICFDKNPLSKFSTKSGDVSYVDYYQKNHNIDIKDKNQPLLISRRKQKVNNEEDIIFCLIPEVCFLTGLRDDMRSDYKLMREIATFTRVSPNQRLLALEKFHNNVNKCEEARNILLGWGLSLNQSCEYITGRQFGDEQIYFGKKTFFAGTNAEFSKYAVNNELLDVVHLQNWLLIHCKNDAKKAKSLYENMDRNSRSLGIKLQKPKIVVLENDRTDTYIRELRNNINKNIQVVVCICPTSRDDRYAAIKKICCSEIPIPSQVINARTLSDETKNRSIVQKIALQINCKLGGSLWAVRIPFKNVMVCGIDSYHDALQKDGSVAAFVASLNPAYTKWYSKAAIQNKKEELSNGICHSFTTSLIAYEKENGRLPESVIIYRDGVGDGQLQLCSSHEIPQLKDACLKRFPAYAIKITFIVVQKRINTRFFEISRNDGGSINPTPGTVVDQTITRKNLYDFFLVSQSVRQGTVTPSHYIVLKDDANYDPDIIQRLSYKLCFLYYNWPGTIRVPACCQYAHKMAYLIGQSIRRATADELSNKLFYL